MCAVPGHSGLAPGIGLRGAVHPGGRPRALTRLGVAVPEHPAGPAGRELHAVPVALVAHGERPVPGRAAEMRPHALARQLELLLRRQVFPAPVALPPDGLVRPPHGIDGRLLAEPLVQDRQDVLDEADRLIVDGLHDPPAVVEQQRRLADVAGQDGRDGVLLEGLGDLVQRRPDVRAGDAQQQRRQAEPGLQVPGELAQPAVEHGVGQERELLHHVLGQADGKIRLPAPQGEHGQVLAGHAELPGRVLADPPAQALGVPQHVGPQR